MRSGVSRTIWAVFSAPRVRAPRHVVARARDSAGFTPDRAARQMGPVPPTECRRQRGVVQNGPDSGSTFARPRRAGTAAGLQRDPQPGRTDGKICRAHWGRDVMSIASVGHRRARGACPRMHARNTDALSPFRRRLRRRVQRHRTHGRQLRAACPPPGLSPHRKKTALCWVRGRPTVYNTLGSSG